MMLGDSVAELDSDVPAGDQLLPVLVFLQRTLDQISQVRAGQVQLLGHLAE